MISTPVQLSIRNFLEAMLFFKFKSFEGTCVAGHDGKANLLRSRVTSR